MDNQNVKNKQKVGTDNGATQAQRFQAPKQPYALKVLEDVLRKEEEELKLWSSLVRKFAWLYCKNSDMFPHNKVVIIGYKDGFGKEFVSNPISLGFTIHIGHKNEFGKKMIYGPMFHDCTIQKLGIVINELEMAKNVFIKSITDEQAEGNFGPCENRIAQLKEVIQNLKTGNAK